MTRRRQRSRWTERDDVIDYVIHCYVGVESGRRVFIWDDEQGNTIGGNIEGFTLHCAWKFDLMLEAIDAKQVHQLLRDLGAPARHYTENRITTGENAGRYQQPEPETWVIREAPPLRVGGFPEDQR